ncbi:hypothetical protein LINGRAHAP2_LOCUS4338 [Linum grandiflorum]
MEENQKMMLESRQVMVENGQQVNLRLASFDERYESHNARIDRRFGMGELPPHGETSIPTFNIPVDQPPAQGFGQPSAIPMTRPYVAPANMGGGSNLGGDHIPPRAYPRPIPPQFNGQGMDPLRFMPPPGGHDVNVLRDQVTQLLTEQLGMGVRSTIPPVYRKPYPEWVDRHHPFPRGFRVPKFPPSHGWATSPPWSMLDGSLSNVVTWVIL